MDENLVAKIGMMTPEQKSQMAQIIKTELASRQAGGTDTTSMTTSTRPRGFLPTATSATENMPNALSIAIRGKPIQEDNMSSKINTLLAEQAIKSQDPLNVAKRQAIEKFSAPETQPKDDDLWKDIPEEDRQYYRIKKTYQNIDGVPVVIDQEIEETAAGKRAMALREKETEVKTGELKTKRDRAEKAIPIIDELLRDKSLKTASGGGALLSAIPGTGWKTAGAKLDQIKGILTLDNLGLMKGVLSDADIRILTNAATSLRQDMPYEDLQRELNTIKSTFKRALSGQGNITQTGQVQNDERSQAKQVLMGKGYSEQEAEQMLGQ